jgi:hypothetical protein
MKYEKEYLQLDVIQLMQPRQHRPTNRQPSRAPNKRGDGIRTLSGWDIAKALSVIMEVWGNTWKTRQTTKLFKSNQPLGYYLVSFYELCIIFIYCWIIFMPPQSGVHIALHLSVRPSVRTNQSYIMGFGLLFS